MDSRGLEGLKPRERHTMRRPESQPEQYYYCGTSMGYLRLIGTPSGIRLSYSQLKFKNNPASPSSNHKLVLSGRGDHGQETKPSHCGVAWLTNWVA